MFHEIQELFDSADTDENGIISFQELSNDYITFLDSRFTNYEDELDVEKFEAEFHRQQAENQAQEEAALEAEKERLFKLHHPEFMYDLEEHDEL